jgi:hypothetical protein
LYWAHYIVVLPAALLEMDWLLKALAVAYALVFFVRSSTHTFQTLPNGKRRNAFLPWGILMVASIAWNCSDSLVFCFEELFRMHLRLAVYLLLLKVVLRWNTDFGSLRANAIRSPKKYFQNVSVIVGIEFFTSVLPKRSLDIGVISGVGVAVIQFTLFWMVFYPAALPKLRKKFVQWAALPTGTVPTTS